VIQTTVNTPLFINIGLCILMLLLSLWRNWFLYAALVFLSATNTGMQTALPRNAATREAVFSGTVISERPFENRVQLLIHIDHVHDGHTTIRCGETVLFYTAANQTFLGKRLLVRGRMRCAARGSRRYVLSGKIVTTTSSGSAIARIQSSVNQHIDAVLNAVLVPVHADIAASLILGGSGRVEEDVRDAFSRAGVLHILAVSGLHVGFVTAIIGFLLLCVPLSLRTKFLLTMLVLFLYAAITGFRTSVCRASIMAFLFGCTVLIQRNVRFVHIVNITALSFVIIDPYTLFNMSAQLSFAAVYGIALLYPVCNDTVVRRVHNRCARRILTVMAVSFSAQIFVSPLLVYYFHRLPVYATISNCVIVPLASVTVGLLFLCLGVSTVFLAGAHLIAFFVSRVLDLIIVISSFFAALPFSTVPLHISPVLLMPFYLLFFRLTRKTAIFVIIGLLVFTSLSALARCTVVIEKSNTCIITAHDRSTIVVTRERKSRSVLAFLERHHRGTISCLVAPQGCRVSADRFCQLPDELYFKRIGRGSLILEISDTLLMRDGMLQLSLMSSTCSGLTEPTVTYIVSDGSDVYRFHAPEYGSIVDQVFVDVRLMFTRILCLF
jgi:ComEC/Rec2-related protein